MVYMNSGCLKLNKYYLNYGQNMVIIMKISVDFYFYSKKSELSSGGNEVVFIKWLEDFILRFFESKGSDFCEFFKWKLMNWV